MPHGRFTNKKIRCPTISSPGFNAAYRVGLVSQPMLVLHVATVFYGEDTMADMRELDL
jgi:hypothetical protein